jgi:hypothetical protein
LSEASGVELLFFPVTNRRASGREPGSNAHSLCDLIGAGSRRRLAASGQPQAERL